MAAQSVRYRSLSFLDSTPDGAEDGGKDRAYLKIAGKGCPTSRRRSRGRWRARGRGSGIWKRAGAAELPQLLNVLFGEMSMIGPRPLLPEDQPSNSSLRLSVRPGISGWAQVKGAKLVTKAEKQKLDEWYVHNASLWLDLRIAMMTIKLLLRGRVSSHEILADTEQVQSKANGSGVASGEEWFAQTGVNTQ